jgi:carbamoyltransferase
MTAILGISAFYHDSAAALVVGGEIVAAAQEERFTRRKHDERFPQNAVEYCLKHAGLTAADLDFVAYYEKPIRRFERLLETYLGFAPAGYRSFRRAMSQWLKQKLYVPREIRNALGDWFRGRIVFAEHHESHAASAFFPSPFEDAAILTMDGVGEWATTTIGVGRGNRIELIRELRFPHSLGLLYSAFTYYTGFKVNSGEYKLMGLAPYGQPIYRDLILEHLIHLKDDGSFWLDMQYFNYCHGLTMTSDKFHRLFGGPPRKPESLLTHREMDLAASVQVVTEDVMLRLARYVRQETGMKNLTLAGGVALNCVGNGRILQQNLFDGIFIQPASGDAGGALGAAMFVWHQLLERPRSVRRPDAQNGSLLGPAFSDDEIAAFLQSVGAVYRTFEADAELCETVAEMLSSEQVVGWFQGRMEFGPRALGARSIIGNARSHSMQSTMNLKIKFRESFRPFAPIVLQEHVHEYFQVPAGCESPYMLLVADVCENRRVAIPDSAATDFGIDKLKHIRSDIPAVTHVDHSARIQTVDQTRNPLLHRLMTCFHQTTGCPVLINTSFNIRSEPIVCTPLDAWRCFQMTDMDVLVLGRHILLKHEQTPLSDTDRASYLSQFEPD